MDDDDVAATTATRPHELVPQLQFPPGYRFVPTEEELVDVYLRAKIEGRNLPLDVVNDVSILDWQPGKLVEAYKGYGENRWFFFTVREQSSSNKEKEPSRKVRGVPGVTATWKATGSVQLIRRRRPRPSKDGDKEEAVVVGTKRVLIYNSSDAKENGKWSMHEYILKDHAQIGQYALYSIQRKQHSDTEDNDDMDPEKKMKKTKKRKRTATLCSEPEGVQPAHPAETTALLAEPPLKPKRKTKAQRKTKKPTSMQVGVEGEHQQQQGRSPMEPVRLPKKDELMPSSQQEARQQQPAAADGAPAPPVVLSAVPLQAVRVCPPSEPGRKLGAYSAPTTEEDTLADMSELWALMNNPLCYSAMLCNNNQGQEQWPPSLAGTTAAFAAAPDTNNVVDHAPFQPNHQEQDHYSLFAVQNQRLTMGENQSAYMWQGQVQYADLFLWDNTTQPMNSGGGGGGGWEHGGDQRLQIHQQQLQEVNNGGNFGVAAGDQHADPMMNHPQGGGGHDLLPSDEQSSGSDDLQADSLVLFGESRVHQMDELDAFVRGVFVPRDEPPQDLAAAGTQEQQEGGDDQERLCKQEQAWARDAATLQSLQHDDLELQLHYLQVLRARNEHVWGGPCSCIACAPGP